MTKLDSTLSPGLQAVEADAEQHTLLRVCYACRGVLSASEEQHAAPRMQNFTCPSPQLVPDSVYPCLTCFFRKFRMSSMQSDFLLSAKLLRCLEPRMSRCRATIHSLDSLRRSATTVAAGDEPSEILICIRQSLCCNVYVRVGRLGCSDSCLQLCSQGVLSISLWPVLSCRSSKQLCSGRQSTSTSMSRQACICKHEHAGPHHLFSA